MSCLLSLSDLFGSSSSSISNFLSYVLTHSKGEQTSSVRLFYGVMAILCFECSTTVIKYKLIIRNRLWNTVAVTQESFQNSRLGKISVSFRVKEKYKYCSLFGGAFVLSASELMKCSWQYIMTCNCCCLRLNPFFISRRKFVNLYFPRKLSKNCKKKKTHRFHVFVAYYKRVSPRSV